MSSVAAPPPGKNMGKPEPRLDARAKVMGAARYSADQATANTAHGWLVTSAIARGRIAGFDLTEALAVPGVLHIMTHQNRPPLGTFKFFGAKGEAATEKAPLSSDRVDHEGEIVAMVVAERFENAREAAYKVKVIYEAETPTASFDDPGVQLKQPPQDDPEKKDPTLGDAEGAYSKAAVKIEVEYETPTQHHNSMELFSTTCVWGGDQLTIYEPSQWVVGLQNGLAHEIKADPSNIRAVSPFVGGAFGAKGSITPRTSLVAMAAKLLDRPVKLVVTRDQGFTIATYRAETRHKIRLGATPDGKLSAYLHESFEVTSRTDDYSVGGNKTTSAMYAIPNIWTKVNMVKADRNTPGFMRAPAEMPYMFAFEAALDELAVALKIDPVELRRRNDTKINPVTGASYTSRSLMACFDKASEAFGWKARNATPQSMRDGDWLVGYGCATAAYPTQMAPAVARVTFNSDRQIRIQVAAHDVGTGAYTVIGQMASELLGTSMSNVKVELGDSVLPPGPVAGGSVTTASTCSAVKIACEAILQRLSGSAIKGITAAENGDLVLPSGDRIAIKKAFETLGKVSVEEVGEFVPDGSKPGALEGAYKGVNAIVGGPGPKATMYSFGAEFVEVRVHSGTKEIRVPRIVGAFAAGRIMNTRTAHSQLLGGLIWGISSALHEETEIDHCTARYVNDNLADYLVPVNADIPDVQVILVPEVDDKVNPAGVKGIGELGNVGTAAAISNAIFHATGKRVRQLPIRLDKLL